MIRQNDMLEGNATQAEMIESEQEVEEVTGPDWLAIARDAFQVADNYVDANIKKQTEKNLSFFASRHPSESKYHSETYRQRSKIFRPKTRSAVRRNQAAATLALFSTQDYVDITPVATNDKMGMIASELNQDLLNHHLENDIKWFMTAIGAYQDSQVQGIVISKQYWDYKETQSTQPDVLDMLGQPVINVDVETDKPVVKLLPMENFLFDPAADWTDVVNSSPYLIELMPMYIGDIKEKMDNGEWIKYDDGVIRTAVKPNNYNSTRNVREGNREDSTDQEYLNSDFAIAWVHHNIVRHKGEDVVYFTLGTELLLSEPIPLNKMYLTGNRPYVIGVSDIETHKTNPAGLVEISGGVQAEVNDVINQRMDNVKLALNKRYFVRRGSEVDQRALRMSSPGSTVMMKDVDKSVKVEETKDVTASSYQEQDRLNVDFDEISGTFNPNTIQSNTNMNQTVGGMTLLSTEANSMTEYQLRVFVETWVEPTLRQLLDLIQSYETNQELFDIIGAKYNLPHGSITSEYIEPPVKLTVNVGFGATNPQAKLNKLGNSLGMIGQFAPQAMQRINEDELVKEIFGASGFKDGSRFLLDEEGGSPESMMVQQLQQQMAQMAQALESKEMDIQVQREKLQVERESIAMNAQKSQQELEASMYRYGADQNLAYTRLKADIASMQADYKNKRDIAALNAKEKLISNKLKMKNINNGFDTY